MPIDVGELNVVVLLDICHLDTWLRLPSLRSSCHSMDTVPSGTSNLFKCLKPH